MPHPTATIEYRQGEAPDAWRPVQVDRLADGSVQLFVRYPADRCDLAINRLRRAIISATLFTAAGFWVHVALGAVVAAITLLGVNRALGQLRRICGAHRWVATPAGVTIERVSPRGYRRRQFLPRERLGEVKATQSGTTWHVSMAGRRFFTGLDEPTTHQIADAVRQGLTTA